MYTTHYTKGTERAVRMLCIPTSTGSIQHVEFRALPGTTDYVQLEPTSLPAVRKKNSERTQERSRASKLISLHPSSAQHPLAQSHYLNTPGIEGSLLESRTAKHATKPRQQKRAKQN